MHRDAGTDGCGHGLFHEEHLAGAGALGGLLDGLALHLGGTAGHADQYARTRPQETGRVNLTDEVLEQRLGHVEVGDHAVLQGPYGADVARRATEHLLGGRADGGHGLRPPRPAVHAHGDDGRLVQDDAPATHVNERVVRTQIDVEVVDFVEDLIGARIRSIDLVDDDNGRQPFLQGLPQHETQPEV